jgi:flavin-dependent dehydrogenase
MDSCDVLIVGGGPAGSSCAWGLRSSGLNVLVVDKARFPRNKVCGGWITPAVVTALEIDLKDYGARRTLQPIKGFRISSIGEPETDVNYPHIVSYGIRRSEFDDYLLRRCQAQVREGEPVASIERTSEGWLVNGNISARLLVGAGGNFCPVARSTGNGTADDPVVAQEIEFAMSPEQEAACKVQPETPELYFCEDLKGYGWCFRKGSFLNIGLGRMDQHNLPNHVAGLLEFLRERGKVPFPVPQRMFGHAYLLFGYSHRKPVDDGLLLIGDAAGLAYSQSGEGIWPAVFSGLAAASAIRTASGDYSQARFRSYAAALAREFGNRSGRLQRLAQKVPAKLRNSLARWLLTTEPFCRRIVVDNWFLHTS